MKQQDKICHRVPIKTEKERQLYRRREEKAIQGTPKIILGKAQPNLQQIWIDDLKNQPILKLKQSNNSQRGHLYARTITNACCTLSLHYGYFIINENMIFLNPQKEIFTWINPDICENHVKIYLPRTHEGELTMMRSIITYLKLWFKCDYSLLAEVKHLNELSNKIENMKIKYSQGFRPKSPERQFLPNRRNSVNMESGELPQRGIEEIKSHGQHLLMDNKSMKEVIERSHQKQSDHFLTSSLSNKLTSPLKFHCNQKEQLKNKTTLVSEKNGAEVGDFEQHRTFNNLSPGVKKAILNKSLGVKGGNQYYPNKTTSNKHHIVSIINQQDSFPNEYGKNKLLLDDKKMNELQVEWQKKGGKESLDGIGQELNDLFLSNIENDEEGGGEHLKQMEQEFSNLLQ